MPAVPPSALAAASLIGGWQVARLTEVRPLGGLVLLAGGVVCARQWYRRSGAGAAAALTGIYLAAFGLSHPLASRIGSWPAVLAVSAAAAGASYLLSERRPAHGLDRASAA